MFKARMKFAKEGRAKYISHLDLMHTMQRAMARCQMPLWFTEGFNQHAYVSVAMLCRKTPLKHSTMFFQKACARLRSIRLRMAV